MNRKSPYLPSSVALLTAALLFVAGCASTKPVGMQVSDAAVTAKVEAKLAGDPQVNAFEIDVDTSHGVVRLSGTVDNPGARAEAEKLARNTSGVSAVINDLNVGDPKAVDNVSDAWIVTKIKSKLTGDPQINPFNIDVDADRGVVTLSGVVAKAAARDEAGRLAQATRGVKQVHNRIEVRTQ